jgi:uncharacterized protein YhbP (UPF0306 family)
MPERIHSTVSDMELEGVDEDDPAHAKFAADMADIAETICSKIKHMKDLQVQHVAEVRRIERELSAIERAVKSGRWWELETTLSHEQIETLSEIEPVDREDLLEESRWL